MYKFWFRNCDIIGKHKYGKRDNVLTVIIIHAIIRVTIQSSVSKDCNRYNVINERIAFPEMKGTRKTC